MSSTNGSSSTLSRCLRQAAASGLGVRFIDRRGAVSDISYQSMLEAARGVGAGLSAKGLRRGDRVAVVFSNEAGFYHAFFGALEAGGIPCPMPPISGLGNFESKSLLESRIEAVDAKFVLTSQRGLRSMAAGLPQCYASRLVPAAELESHDRLTESDAALESEPEPEEVALIQFSSGTTGRPKAVALTHDQLLSNIRAMLDWMFAAHPERGFFHRGVSWLPLYHDMGLVGAALTAIVRPGPLTLMAPERFVSRPVSWLREIADRRATVSPAPNFAFELVSERVSDSDLEALDLSCWKLALCGAEPVSVRTLQRFARRLKPCGFRAEALTPVYGMAEAALAISFSPAHSPVRARSFDAERLRLDGLAIEKKDGVSLVSLGGPIDGVSIRIVDRDDGQHQDQPQGRLGRVLIKGRSVIQNYYLPASGQRSDSSRFSEGQDLDAPAFVDGWLDTGDLGFMVDGELYLYGRIKELLIIRGRNYAPVEIEAASRRDASGNELELSVDALAALAVYDPVESCERLVLAIEFLADKDSSQCERFEQAIRSNLSRNLGVLPWRVVFLSERFPRTSSGKLQRSLLAERILDATS